MGDARSSRTALRDRYFAIHASIKSGILRGLSTWANHSALLAARRRPRSSRGSFSLPQQAGDLFSRRCVPHMGAGAEGRLVKIVQRGEPARKELAINHALDKPVDRPESKLE